MSFFLLIHDRSHLFPCFFFFNDTATTEIYTLSLHDALPISTFVAGAASPAHSVGGLRQGATRQCDSSRSEEHTSELQSRLHLVCRLLLEKKKKKKKRIHRRVNRKRSQQTHYRYMQEVERDAD